jgi:hypothetical protein
MSGFTMIVILILVMFASLAIYVLQADESELTAKSPHEEPRFVSDGDDDPTSPEWADEISPLDENGDELFDETDPEQLGAREDDEK